MSMKKTLIVLVGLVAIGFIFYGWRFISTQENIKQFFVHAACNTNALASYAIEDSIANHLEVYETIRKDFDAYNVEEWHLAHFAKKNDVKLGRFVNWMTDSIAEQCGHSRYSKSQIRGFVISMLGIAGSGLDKLKAQIEN